MSNNLKSGQFSHSKNEVVGRVPKERSKSRPKVVIFDQMSNVFGGFVILPSFGFWGGKVSGSTSRMRQGCVKDATRMRQVNGLFKFSKHGKKDVENSNLNATECK